MKRRVEKKRYAREFRAFRIWRKNQRGRHDWWQRILRSENFFEQLKAIHPNDGPSPPIPRGRFFGMLPKESLILEQVETREWTNESD